MITPAGASSPSLNGFDLTHCTVPTDEILSGGPPRDGIPSIDHPQFVPAARVDYLRDDDIVIGLVRGDQARAYPLRILVWHEIVNDVIAGEPVAVTYCPLCGTSMVFDARVGGRRRSFGVSGLLYNSDVLMYDRQTESLWSQIAMKAISGPDAGKELTWLPSQQMTWRAWREKHQASQVLSLETGHDRDYTATAYASYFASDQTMFPVRRNRDELPSKAWVLGVVLNGRAKAYAIARLPDSQTLTDKVGEHLITVRWNAAARHAQVHDQNGREVPSVQAFWFAWQAFYPETQLWNP